MRIIVILKANKTPSSASLVNEDHESESRLAKQKSSAQKSHTCARLPAKGNKYSRAPKARAEKTLDICSAQNSQNRSSYVNQSQEAELESLPASSRIMVTNRSDNPIPYQSKSQIQINNLEREEAIPESKSPINNCALPVHNSSRKLYFWQIVTRV